MNCLHRAFIQHCWRIALIVLISRWTDLTRRCSPRRLLRLEGAAASCAQAEACVLASEPSLGMPQGQPRAKRWAKVKSQWSSVSPSSPSAQEPIRRAKMMQVWSPNGGDVLRVWCHFSNLKRGHYIPLYVVMGQTPPSFKLAWDEGNSLKCRWKD